MWIREKLTSLYNRYKAEKLLKTEATIPLTDFKNACVLRDNLPLADHVAMNANPGYFYWIKHFAGIDENMVINCAINHGITLDGICDVLYEISHPVSTILIASESQKKRIEKHTNLNAVPVGPYIHYVDEYLSDEEFYSKKKKLGKVLLAFPSHCIPVLDFIYDYQEFIDKIKELGKNFDTVLVCLHWCDIHAKKEKAYLENGLKIVSAGYDGSRSFLSRQKTIIKLADAVIGNAYTTGLTFALHLNKPVYLFKQQLKFEDIGNNNEVQLERVEGLMDEFFEVCGDETFNSLEKQKKWCEYYFGFNQVKTREELRNLLLPLARK